jgi:hypothetical protein
MLLIFWEFFNHKPPVSAKIVSSLAVAIYKVSRFLGGRKFWAVLMVRRE